MPGPHPQVGSGSRHPGLRGELGSSKSGTAVKPRSTRARHDSLLACPGLTSVMESRPWGTLQFRARLRKPRVLTQSIRVSPGSANGCTSPQKTPLPPTVPQVTTKWAIAECTKGSIHADGAQESMARGQWPSPQHCRQKEATESSDHLPVHKPCCHAHGRCLAPHSLQSPHPPCLLSADMPGPLALVRVMAVT